MECVLSYDRGVCQGQLEKKLIKAKDGKEETYRIEVSTPGGIKSLKVQKDIFDRLGDGDLAEVEYEVGTFNDKDGKVVAYNKLKHIEVILQYSQIQRVMTGAKMTGGEQGQAAQETTSVLARARAAMGGSK